MGDREVDEGINEKNKGEYCWLTYRDVGKEKPKVEK